MTEPNAGTDASRQKTTAVKKGDHYVLNGSKCFITNGGIAGIYTVLAVTNRDKGIMGLTAFIVERDREGVSIGKEEDKMGMRLSNTCEVIFDNVRVPKDHVLGREGAALSISCRRWTTPVLAWCFWRGYCPPRSGNCHGLQPRTQAVWQSDLQLPGCTVHAG